MWQNFPGAFAAPEFNAHSGYLMRPSDQTGQEFSEGTAWMALLCTLCAGAQLHRLEAEAFHSDLESVPVFGQTSGGTVSQDKCTWSPSGCLGLPNNMAAVPHRGRRESCQFLKAGLKTNISSHSLFCGSKSLPVLPRYWGKAKKGVSTPQEASLSRASSAFGPHL